MASAVGVRSIDLFRDALLPKLWCTVQQAKLETGMMFYPLTIPYWNVMTNAVPTSNKQIETSVENLLCIQGPWDTLLYVSQQYNNVKVVIVSEVYTSKTSGSCACIHAKLGGSKIFKCPNQSYRWTCDRDLDGARNISLRWLTESVNLPPTIVGANGSIPLALRPTSCYADY